jgi:hypothetical protein
MVPTKDMVLKNANPIGKVVEALTRRRYSLRTASSGCKILLIQPSENVRRRLDRELYRGLEAGMTVRRSDSVSQWRLHHSTPVAGY